MKILLTVPLSSERFNAIPDIGLGYLATHARDAGHEVRLLDCLLHRVTFNDFVGYIRDFKPDVVGFKTYSCDWETVRQMTDLVRRTLPAATTVIGGPHPTCDIPEQLFIRFPNLDFAFCGETERSFPLFLAMLSGNGPSRGDVAGLVWRDEAGVHANPQDFVTDLDALKFPSWDLIDPRWYTYGYTFMTTRLPAAPMQITRGCPFQCTFCGSHQITGKKVRRRSVGHVVEEIKLLKEHYKVRTIDIVDENFAFNRQYLIEFCEHLLAEKIEIAWNCPYGVRLNSLDEEVVRLMERSGCFGFSVGIESGSQKILDLIKKNLTVQEVIEKITMIKKVSSLYVQGYFMMGFPGETRADVEKTINLACSLPFDLVSFCPLRVTPGTRIYEDLVAAGTIRESLDFRGLGHHYFVRSYCDIPDREMLALYRKAAFRFFFRPHVVFNLLRRVRSWAQIRNIIQGLLRVVHSPHQT